MSLQQLSMFSVSLESVIGVGLVYFIFSERILCQSPPVPAVLLGIVTMHSQVPQCPRSISFNLFSFLILKSIDTKSESLSRRGVHQFCFLIFFLLMIYSVKQVAYKWLDVSK